MFKFHLINQQFHIITFFNVEFVSYSQLQLKFMNEEFLNNQQNLTMTQCVSIFCQYLSILRFCMKTIHQSCIETSNQTTFLFKTEISIMLTWNLKILICRKIMIIYRSFVTFMIILYQKLSDRSNSICWYWPTWNINRIWNINICRMSFLIIFFRSNYL